ncbi:MAG: TonB-dependent receptor domain-containing protein [Gammaproteobacteria bacterium]
MTENGDNRRNVGPTEDLFGAGPGNDAFGYRDLDGDVHAGEYNRDGSVKVEADGVSGKLTWHINDNLTLVNIGAFDLTDRLQEEDTEASPAPLVNPTFGADTQQWTEELRLHGDYDNLRWLAGFYYFNQEVDAKYLLDLTNLGFVFFDAGYDQDTESWSVFSQVEYDFAPRWSATFGIRFTDETKEMNYQNIDTTGLFGFLTGIGAAPPVGPTRPTPNHAFLFNRQSVGGTLA